MKKWNNIENIKDILFNLAERSSEGFFIRSVDQSQLMYISPSFKLIFGRDLAELYSTPELWLDFVYPEDKKRLKNAYKRHHSDVEPEAEYVVEYRIVKPDNEIRWIYEWYFPLFDDPGTLIAFSGIVRDITETKHAEQALQDNAEKREKRLESHLENIINYVPHFIFWKDTDSVFLGCNKMFAEAAGLKDPSEIVGKTDYDLPWDKAQSDSYRADDQEIIKTGKPKLYIEETQTTADGRNIALLTSKVPLKDERGDVTGVLGIYTDITKQKIIESELRTAKEKAEESNKLKSEFISNMQHDIRTPFVGIYGMVDLLAKEEADPEKRSILNDVALSAKELMDYCDSILDFSNIESGSSPVIFKSFPLRKTLQSIITIESVAARSKKLDLSLQYDEQLPDVMIGDPYRLKRILINLISNAVKFTKEGFVRVSVSLSKQEQEARKIVVKFVVEDSGIGIPDDKQGLVYERFTKVTPSNKGLYKGLGLGLRIVKQFVDELDGDIHLKSEVGEGSTFIVFLPFKIPLSDEIIDTE